MKVAQFESEAGSCVAVELNGKWINYSKAFACYYLLEHDLALRQPESIMEMLQFGIWGLDDMKAIVTHVKKHRLQRLLSLPKGAVLKPPIARPGKIVALGLNYALHAKEGSFEVPKEPIIFAKVGSSVVGPYETIRIPRGLGRMDHEVELAVVIGRTATKVKKRDAYKYVAGYTICNDVSARDLQTSDISAKLPWFRSKSFDTFSPIGPWIVTTDEFRPPIHVNVECRVNGKVKQKANTRDLVFNIPTTIEFITKHITLEPGDIVSTGTPAGIGPIRHGDTVVCRVEKIGELKNPVRRQ
ncbi:MAG TPA: fumarylacetoacetate hydrolase family protein [Bacteroidota bacterium]